MAESETALLAKTKGFKFQSSSCWRMAERKLEKKQTEAILMFQSSSCWRMAESSWEYHIEFADGKRFNPHHAGEWLKVIL